MRLSKFALTVLACLSFTANTYASDTEFFHGIQGKWKGPGEIVAGKYKGTKFVCTFDGTNPSKDVGMNVDGSCRVGVFTQKMNADIIKTAGQYIGKFLDGAKGDGMDVRGGRFTKNRLVVDIKRKNLNGIMVANLSDPKHLKVTISVKHNKTLIPVIGMNLRRQSGRVITGSLN